MNPSMYEFLTVPGAAAFYSAVMQFAHTVKSRLNLDWREVRYECVVANFEPQMQAICSYVGLEWHSAMGEFAQRVQSREHATPSTAQLSQGLITSATAQWRHYEAQLAPAVPTLQPWLERLGYR